MPSTLPASAATVINALQTLERASWTLFSSSELLPYACRPFHTALVTCEAAQHGLRGLSPLPNSDQAAGLIPTVPPPLQHPACFLSSAQVFPSRDTSVSQCSRGRQRPASIFRLTSLWWDSCTAPTECRRHKATGAGSSDGVKDASSGSRSSVSTTPGGASVDGTDWSSLPLERHTFTVNGGRHEVVLVAATELPPLRSPRTAAQQRCLQAALGVIHRLRQHGYTAMFAGGWVRDQFLGRPSPDIDLVTNATYVQLFEVFGARHCRLKGGSTCDVTADGHVFEITSYRGGLLEDSAEAEWRDAGCRDFSINALFFDPQLPNPTTMLPVSTASSATTITNPSRAPTPGAPTLHGPSGTAVAAATPSVFVTPPHLQPAGLVRDYMGGLADLHTRTLRCYRGHLQGLGSSTSSVEADPIRVLRAARLAVDLGLQVEPYTRERIQRAAKQCVVRAQGVTANRVFRELAKMAELDGRSGGREGRGGGGAEVAGGDGAGGGNAAGACGAGPGSPLFGRALALCAEWGVLEALFKRLPQQHLPALLSNVFPRLPAALPLELKLAALVAVRLPGGFYPTSQLASYEPVLSLLRATRAAQPHWPELLCDLVDLTQRDGGGARAEEWRAVLGAEGADMVVKTLMAFVAHNEVWRRDLQGLLEERLRDVGGQVRDQLRASLPGAGGETMAEGRGTR